MKLKKEKKIRKLLGERFHLYVDNNGNWKLFRKYNDLEIYFSNENTEIMNSEDNSEKELLKFAKKNRKYNVEKSIITITSVILWLAVGLAFVNIFISSEIVIGFILGIEFLAVCQVLIKSISKEHNFNLANKDLEEEIKLQTAQNKLYNNTQYKGNRFYSRRNRFTARRR